MSIGQTNSTGQTEGFQVSSVTDRCTIASAVTDSAFRFDNMRATFPPLSASSAAARTIAPRNAGSHGTNRTLGTSRMNGCWGEQSARGSKRRGSLSSDPGSNSSGHHQRQTLKLADITHFDLMRPSTFEKLSGLYRDRSALDGPGAHTILGTGEQENESSGKGINPKSKSGSGHHVHLPRISMDSSPPLVSFRHSRIKPSTLTEAETGVPGVTSHAADRQSTDVIGVKLSPQSHNTRRNEQSAHMDRNSKGTSSGKRRQSQNERLNDTQSSRQTTLQTLASATKVSSPVHVTTGLSNLNKPEIPTIQNTSGQTTKTMYLEATPRRTTKGNEKESIAFFPDEVETHIDPPKKNYSNVYPKTTGEATVTSTSTPHTEKPEHSPVSAINTDSFSSSVSRYQNDGVDSTDLTMSEYTSIFINNNGFEGETLSVVKSDTFLGEKRSVRFSVNNEVIEYEPGVSLSDDKQAKLDKASNYEINGE